MAREIKKIFQNSNFKEAPLLASRIYAADAIAHNVCSTRAIERACSISETEQTKALRKILVLAEIGRNHTHELCNKERTAPRSYDSLTTFFNLVISTISGHMYFPISNAIGGFTHLPPESLLEDFRIQSKKLLKTTEDLRPSSSKTQTHAKKSMAIRPRANYFEPSEDIWLSDGGSFDTKDLSSHVVIEHGPSGPIALIDGGRVITGPLARFTLNKKTLYSEVASLATTKNGIYLESVQYLEIAESIVEIGMTLQEILASKIRNEHILPPKKFGTGFAAVESTKGLIFHSVKLDRDGKIAKYEFFTPVEINAIQ